MLSKSYNPTVKKSAIVEETPLLLNYYHSQTE